MLKVNDLVMVRNPPIPPNGCGISLYTSKVLDVRAGEVLVERPLSLMVNRCEPVWVKAETVVKIPS